MTKKNLHIIIEQETHQKLKTKCSTINISISDLLRNFIKQFLTGEEHET